MKKPRCSRAGLFKLNLGGQSQFSVVHSLDRRSKNASGTMSNRKRLPERRASETMRVECFGLGFTTTVSWFADGSLGEVFLTNHKAGSMAGIMASDAAIAASLALQFGCPIEVLRKALSRDARGAATGPLGVALDLLEAV